MCLPPGNIIYHLCFLGEILLWTKSGFSTEVCEEPKGWRCSEPLLCLRKLPLDSQSDILVDLQKENIRREKLLGVLFFSLRQGEPGRDQVPDLFQLCCSPLAAFCLESSREGEHTRRHRSPLEPVMGISALAGGKL